MATPEKYYSDLPKNWVLLSQASHVTWCISVRPHCSIPGVCLSCDSMWHFCSVFQLPLTDRRPFQLLPLPFAFHYSPPCSVLSACLLSLLVYCLLSFRDWWCSSCCAVSQWPPVSAASLSFRVQDQLRWMGRRFQISQCSFTYQSASAQGSILWQRRQFWGLSLFDSIHDMLFPIIYPPVLYWHGSLRSRGLVNMNILTTPGYHCSCSVLRCSWPSYQTHLRF